MAYLTLKNIVFDYPDGFNAIDDVSISIEKGEFVAIVGQNGAGKTTTVKLMNGLLKPTKGEVIVGCKNTKDYTVAEMSKTVGYVFQNPDDQIFNEDVYEEVEFGPKNMGFPEEKVKELVKKAILMTGIREYVDENPYNLPYSTRKLVSIASIIAMDPEVIILDEPTAGQDMAGMGTLAYILENLKREGKTVITITHDMEFVVRNFDRVIAMANKKVVKDSDKSDIFWDHDVLKKCMLKQPYISRVAYGLGIEGDVINIDGMIDKIKAMANNKKD